MPKLEFELTKINLNMIITVLGFLATWVFFGLGMWQDLETAKKDLLQQRKELNEIAVTVKSYETLRASLLVEGAEIRTKVDTVMGILNRIEQRQFDYTIERNKRQ